MCGAVCLPQLQGKVKWEWMWVIFVECIAYAAALVSPDADFVSIHLTNGNGQCLLSPRPLVARRAAKRPASADA